MAGAHFERVLFKSGSQTGLHVDFATRPLRLRRGVDRCRRNDFTIASARPPQHSFSFVSVDQVVSAPAAAPALY